MGTAALTHCYIGFIKTGIKLPIWVSYVPIAVHMPFFYVDHGQLFLTPGMPKKSAQPNW